MQIKQFITTTTTTILNTAVALSRNAEICVSCHTVFQHGWRNALTPLPGNFFFNRMRLLYSTMIMKITMIIPTTDSIKALRLRLLQKFSQVLFFLCCWFKVIIISDLFLSLQKPFWASFLSHFPPSFFTSVRQNRSRLTAWENSRHAFGAAVRRAVHQLVISGIAWWTSSPCDWLMVALSTINQSLLMLVHPNDPRNGCAESLYPFPL